METKISLKCYRNIIDSTLTLDYVKTKLKGCSAGKVSDWSHNFKGYKETKNGQIIDYKYAKYLILVIYK